MERVCKACLRACACVRMYYAAGRGGGSSKAGSSRSSSVWSVEVVCVVVAAVGSVIWIVWREKNEEMGSLCTCFQGNRGLQNTGRLDILFSMCCTALWQNTADLSNDSESPHRRPRRCSAVFHLKLHPCMHVAAYFTGTCSNTCRCWRCGVIERKPQIRRIIHT